MAFLLIDFGASRVKAGIYSEDTVIHTSNYNPVSPCLRSEYYFEISPFLLQQLFEKIVNDYSHFPLKGIFICSEMHGFVLEHEHGTFATNYISWQDNRCIEKIDGISTLDYLKQLCPDIKKHTGMYLKSGLPSLNLLHMLRKKQISKGSYKMLSLPEIFGAEKIHNIMLSGLGIWDIYARELYKPLLRIYEQFGCDLSINVPTNCVEITGFYRGIPIYTAIGDCQCALYGMDLKKNQVILNLGTGSQVAYVDDEDTQTLMEQRPFLDEQTLSIITHIPSGRALNCYVEFLHSVIKFSGGGGGICGKIFVF